MIFTAIAATRCLFAWSFDRLLPERVATVSERTHSPVNATLITAIVAEIALYFYTYHGGIAFLEARPWAGCRRSQRPVWRRLCFLTAGRWCSTAHPSRCDDGCSVCR